MVPWWTSGPCCLPRPGCPSPRVVSTRPHQADPPVLSPVGPGQAAPREKFYRINRTETCKSSHLNSSHVKCFHTSKDQRDFNAEATKTEIEFQLNFRKRKNIYIFLNFCVLHFHVDMRSFTIPYNN